MLQMLGLGLNSPKQGARDFYEGDIARQLGHEIQAAGGALAASDLAAYRVRVGPALAIPYRNAIVHATPELTAGPTLANTLQLLSRWNAGDARPDAAAYTAYAPALQQAYRARLNDMGDMDGKRALGAEYLAPSCTSHFSVVDEHGNMAAVTQTLLSIFGSRFVTPDTGILMNNGIMWFDTEPGKANSLAAGKRCLCNYTPVIAHIGGRRESAGSLSGAPATAGPEGESRPERFLALGASGGRRILPAVTQLLSFVIDYSMDLDSAFHTPRLDASEGEVVIGDSRLDTQTHATLGAQFDYEVARVQTMPMKFACPSAVMRGTAPSGDIVNSGASETFQPWSDAIAS